MTCDKHIDEARDQFDSTFEYKNESNTNEIEFGVLFDIDGVLARGQNPLPCAVEMFDKMKNEAGEPLIPTVFLTNACSLSDTKVNQIQKWFNMKIVPETIDPLFLTVFGIVVRRCINSYEYTAQLQEMSYRLPCDVTPDQVIQSPSPLKVFTQWHDKCVLFVGQENIVQIAHELGFKQVVTLDQVKRAYPLLDVVDHENRRKVAKGYEEVPMETIDAIILMGEPINWESYLQLLIDLLVTNGKPDHAPESFPEKHLPILACNMDLVFMAEAVMPRFGHGAFLLCLEALYEKITGFPLKYTSIIGKPSEISFRFAEHTISMLAQRMGIKSPIKRLYFFGDNPAVDILGANLYNNYLQRFRRMSGGKEASKEERNRVRTQAAMSSSRVVPAEAEFLPQIAKQIDSILVHTGVYKPEKDSTKKSTKPSYCHRDFSHASELDNPMIDVENCLEGMKQIFQTENFHPKL